MPARNKFAAGSKASRLAALWLAAAFCASGQSTASPPPAFDLPNFAVASQQAVNWCWAAANQMVSRSLGSMVEQCDLAKRRFGFECCQARWSCSDPDSDSLFRCDSTSVAFQAEQDPIAFSQNRTDAVLPLADLQRILAIDKSPVVVVRRAKGGSLAQHYVVLTGYSSTAERGVLLKVFDPDCTPTGIYTDGYTYAAYRASDPNYGYGQETYDFQLLTPATPPTAAPGLASAATGLLADKVDRAVSFTLTARRMVSESADSAGTVVNEVKSDPGFAVSPTAQPLDLTVLSASLAKGGFPAQMPVLSISLDDLRHYRAALTPKRIMEQSEMMTTVVQDGKVLQAAFLTKNNGVWTPYRYGGMGVVEALFKQLAEDSARSKTPAGDYFAVFIPGIETYFLARETGKTLHLIPLSTKRKYGIVAGTDLIGRDFLARLGQTIDQEMAGQGK